MIPNPLEEIGTIEATPTPGDLATKASTSATQLYVEEYVRAHSTLCPTTKRVQRFTMLAVLLLGALLAVQTVGVLAGRAILRDVVRSAVREELDARHLSARVQPSTVLAEGDSPE